MKQNKIPRNEYIRKPVGKTNPYKEDTIYTDMGQWKYPGQVTKIPSGDITMQGVPYPVYGEDNLGYSQMMYPGMDYQFPGQYVTEYPQIARNGGGLLNKTLTCPSCGWSWKAVDGGTDITTCHKCGGTAKLAYGGDPSLPNIEDHYPFGGQNSKTGTHFQEGGWLDKYQGDVDGSQVMPDEDGWLSNTLNTIYAKLNPYNWGVKDYSGSDELGKWDWSTANYVARDRGDKEFMHNNKRYAVKDKRKKEDWETAEEKNPEFFKNYALNYFKKMHPKDYEKRYKDLLNSHYRYGNPDVTIEKPGSGYSNDYGRAYFNNAENQMHIYGLHQNPNITKIDTANLMGDYAQELLHARQLKDLGEKGFSKHIQEDLKRNNVHYEPSTKKWVNYDETMYTDPKSIEGVHYTQGNALWDRLMWRNYHTEEDPDKKEDRDYYLNYYKNRKFHPYEDQNNLRTLQKALSEAGYDMSESLKKDGTYDGIYGEQTKNALYNWQKGYTPTPVKKSNVTISAAPTYNKKYGGWLDEMQKGGAWGTPQEMYNDSLNLYKAYQFQKKNIKPHQDSFSNTDEFRRDNPKGKIYPKGQEWDWKNRVGDDYSAMEDLEKAYPGENNKQIVDYYKTLKFNAPTYIGLHSSPDLYHKNISPVATYYDSNAYSPVYKKPVYNPSKETLKTLPNKKEETATISADHLPMIQAGMPEMVSREPEIMASPTPRSSSTNNRIAWRQDPNTKKMVPVIGGMKEKVADMKRIYNKDIPSSTGAIPADFIPDYGDVITFQNGGGKEYRAKNMTEYNKLNKAYNDSLMMYNEGLKHLALNKVKYPKDDYTYHEYTPKEKAYETERFTKDGTESGEKYNSFKDMTKLWYLDELEEEKKNPNKKNCSTCHQGHKTDYLRGETNIEPVGVSGHTRQYAAPTTKILLPKDRKQIWTPGNQNQYYNTFRIADDLGQYANATTEYIDKKTGLKIDPSKSFTEKGEYIYPKIGKDIVSKEMGGWLDEMQKGGRTPIVVDDKNNPKLKSYTDSLALYNLSQKAKKLFDVDPMDPTLEGYNKKANALASKSKIKPTKLQLSGYNQDYPKNFDPGAMEEPWMVTYKKPVQPYILKSEDRHLMTGKDWQDVNSNDYGAEEAKIRSADPEKFDIYRLPNNKFELVPKTKKPSQTLKKTLTSIKKKELSPIIVNDPNDPRLKAYDDSLGLYKSTDYLLSHPLTGDYVPGKEYFKNSKINTDNDNKRIGVKEDLRTGYVNLYKKPVQPYVYEEPIKEQSKKAEPKKAEAKKDYATRNVDFSSPYGPVMKYYDAAGKVIRTEPYVLPQQKNGGWLDELDEEYRRGGQRRRRGTSKNIESSINDVFRRNYDVFGPAGKSRFNPRARYEEGGWLDKYQDAGQLRAATTYQGAHQNPVAYEQKVNAKVKQIDDKLKTSDKAFVVYDGALYSNPYADPERNEFLMPDKSGSYVPSGIDPFTAFLSAPQQVIKTVSTTLPKAVKAVGEKFKSLKGLPKGAKAVENFKKVMGDLDIDKVISLSQHEKDIALNRENLIKAAISGNQEEFTKAQNTMNHLMAQLADQTKNTGDIGGKLGTAKDVARMKDLKAYGLKTEFLPTVYQRKLDTDLIKYNNEYGTSFFVRNPNPTEADKFTGYTDVPQFNKQIEALKTKAEFGKRPLEVREWMDPVVQNFLAKRYFQNDISSNMFSKSLARAQFNINDRVTDVIPSNYFRYYPPTKFDQPFNAKDAFQQLTPNKYGGQQRGWLDKYNNF